MKFCWYAVKEWCISKVVVRIPVSFEGSLPQPLWRGTSAHLNVESLRTCIGFFEAKLMASSYFQSWELSTPANAALEEAKSEGEVHTTSSFCLQVLHSVDTTAFSNSLAHLPRHGKQKPSSYPETLDLFPLLP